jgi:hypothetical protein
MPNRVIARYRDGRMLKGTTINFRPEAPHCHIVPIDRPYDEGQRVDFKDLKAVFFVRDLRGNPLHTERKEFVHPLGYGRRVRVVFTDGEEMLGIAHQVDRKKPGFFLFPADPDSNNERVFAIFAALKEIEFLGEGTAAGAAQWSAAAEREGTLERPAGAESSTAGEKPAGAGEATAS